MRKRKRLDKERLKKGVLDVLPGGLIAVLVIHFAFTIMYLTPPNPVRLRTQSVVEGYMEPFFGQGWTLFAPGVRSISTQLLVSCRLEDEQGTTRETPWANISAPYLELMRRYRFTPAERIYRAQMTPVYLISSAEDSLASKIIERTEQGTESDSEEDSQTDSLQSSDTTSELEQAAAIIEMLQEEDRALGEVMLARVASAECDRLYGVSRTTHVRSRIVIIQPPPFSKRHQPIDPESTRYIEYEWQPYEKVAAL